MHGTIFPDSVFYCLAWLRAGYPLSHQRSPFFGWISTFLVMLCAFSVILWQNLSSACLDTLSSVIMPILVADLGRLESTVSSPTLPPYIPRPSGRSQFPLSKLFAIPNTTLIQSDENVWKIPIHDIVLAAAKAMLSLLQLPTAQSHVCKLSISFLSVQISKGRL